MRLGDQSAMSVLEAAEERRGRARKELRQALNVACPEVASTGQNLRDDGFRSKDAHESALSQSTAVEKEANHVSSRELGNLDGPALPAFDKGCQEIEQRIWRYPGRVCPR